MLRNGQFCALLVPQPGDVGDSRSDLGLGSFAGLRDCGKHLMQELAPRSP